jgi:hypothetical protein
MLALPPRVVQRLILSQDRLATLSFAWFVVGEASSYVLIDPFSYHSRLYGIHTFTQRMLELRASSSILHTMRYRRYIIIIIIIIPSTLGSKGCIYSAVERYT